MKRYFFLSILILSTIWVSAKNPKQQIAASDTTVYTVVDKMPEFPGGSDSLKSFIAHQYVFPIEDSESAPTGRTIIQFIIEKDGSISHIIIVRSVDPYIDREAIRVVRILPKWKPGFMKGKAVRVKYILPVSFRNN